MVQVLCGWMAARTLLLSTVATLLALQSLQLVDSSCQCSLSFKIPTTVLKTCDVRKGVCPYEFSGCGAQTGLYEKTSKFAGGFPISVCAIAEGSTCQGETKLLKGVQWMPCSGMSNCNATKGKLAGIPFSISTLATNPYRCTNCDRTHQIGADWTDCCRKCTTISTCTSWDFEISTATCRMFSSTGPAQMADDFITGQQGSDEKPLDCWLRSKEGPCINNVGKIMSVAIGLLIAGICSHVVFAIYTVHLWIKYVETPISVVSQSVSEFEKKGTFSSEIRTVRNYQAEISWYFRLEEYRAIVTRNDSAFLDGERIYVQIARPQLFKLMTSRREYISAIVSLSLLASAGCFFAEGIHGLGKNGGEFLLALTVAESTQGSSPIQITSTDLTSAAVRAGFMLAGGVILFLIVIVSYFCTNPFWLQFIRLLFLRNHTEHVLRRQNETKPPKDDEENCRPKPPIRTSVGTKV